MISERPKLIQNEYKNRHDWVGKVIHWELSKKFHQINRWFSLIYIWTTLIALDNSHYHFI